MGFEPMIQSFLYVDLANQCLKPLSHTSKLLIGIWCAGFGWFPEGLSDPINCVSRSALARVLFLYLWARLYPDLWISPASKRDSIKICHSLGDAFFSMSTPPLNDALCQSSPPDPTRREHRVKPRPYPPEWNSYLLRPGESPGNWTVTLLLHYGEVHSRHDRPTSYRSARRTKPGLLSLLY